MAIYLQANLYSTSLCHLLIPVLIKRTRIQELIASSVSVTDISEVIGSLVKLLKSKKYLTGARGKMKISCAKRVNKLLKHIYIYMSAFKITTCFYTVSLIAFLSLFAYHLSVCPSVYICVIFHFITSFMCSYF